MPPRPSKPSRRSPTTRRAPIDDDAPAPDVDELDDDQASELDDQAAELDEAEHEAAPIRMGERFFICGMSGTGKSELGLNAFASYPGQRILIDPADHYELGPAALAEEPPPLEVDDPRGIDWRHRTIRYVPARPGDRGEMNRLFAAIFRRGNLFYFADEFEDVAPSAGGGAPAFVRRTLKQGRKFRITQGGASPRPSGVERAARNQATHAFAFAMVDVDDAREMAPRFGMSAEALIDAVLALPKYGYLQQTLGRLDERQRPLVLRMPPLSPATIDFTRQHVINPEFAT